MRFVHRYPRTQEIMTNLDKFGDVVGWIEGLRSHAYLTSLIEEHHATHIKDTSSSVARKAIPFLEAALSFIEQAQKGPQSVAFLPLYYALLNLAKIYILLGPHGRELQTKRNRVHGAHYSPAWDDQLPLNKQKYNCIDMAL